MPRPGTIHKSYHPVKVVMTNGEEIVMRSACSNDVLKLDIDCKTHPAWTRKTGFVNEGVGEVKKFQDRYASLSFMSKSPAAAQESAPSPQEAE